MPKPGYFDGTEAQVVLEPSSFARELAESARGWADANAKRGAEAAAAAASATEAATETAEATTTTATPPLLPPLAEARGRDPRSALPGGWVRVRVVDSCTASGPEGGLRFCVEIFAVEGEGEGGRGGEDEEEKHGPPPRRPRRWWVPLAWIHPSSPNPVLAVRPLPPPPKDTEEELSSFSWSAGDEAEVSKGVRAEGGSWWPATILEVKGCGGDGDGGGGDEREEEGGGGADKDNASAIASRTLVVRIEPCCCYPTGAVVSVPAGAAGAAGGGKGGGSSSHSVRKKPPLPPLFEVEAARLQLEQERAERSGRLGGGFGSRGGVLGSGRRWSGMATSFGESVHPEEWRRRTAGLLVTADADDEGEERGEGAEEEGGEEERKAAAPSAAAGPSAGDASGARTHLIAGFSVEAALCPGQLSTAAAAAAREEEEEEEEEEEGEEDDGEGGAAAAAGEAKGEGEEGGEGGKQPQQQPRRKKRRKTTTTTTRTNRDPFGYDGSARALLEAGGSL